jgi:hypothetical protein
MPRALLGKDPKPGTIGGLDLGDFCIGFLGEVFRPGKEAGGPLPSRRAFVGNFGAKAALLKGVIWRAAKIWPNSRSSGIVLG